MLSCTLNLFIRPRIAQPVAGFEIRFTHLVTETDAIRVDVPA